MELTCGHVFCDSCIAPQLRLLSECPECRQQHAVRSCRCLCFIASQGMPTKCNTTDINDKNVRCGYVKCPWIGRYTGKCLATLRLASLLCFADLEYHLTIGCLVDIREGMKQVQCDAVSAGMLLCSAPVVQRGLLRRH